MLVSLNTEAFFGYFPILDPNVMKISNEMVDQFEGIVERMGKEKDITNYDGFDFSYQLGWIAALMSMHINIPTEIVKENLLERIDSFVVYSLLSLLQKSSSNRILKERKADSDAYEDAAFGTATAEIDDDLDQVTRQRSKRKTPSPSRRGKTPSPSKRRKKRRSL